MKWLTLSVSLALRAVVNPPLARDLVTFHDAVNALVGANDSVRLLCDTDGETRRVKTLLDEAGLGAERRLAAATGRLSHGFQTTSIMTLL